MLEKIGHALINKFIGNRLFGLVFIGGLGGKGGRHQHQAILYVGKVDFALIFQVFATLL